MMRDPRPPRQPLFWAASAFSSWPLDGRACLASSVVVGNRYLDFSLRRFMGSGETLLASEDTFFGRVGTARRSFCPDSLPAII